MNLFGTVDPVREAEDIQFNVQVKKEIKDDDWLDKLIVIIHDF